MPVDVLARRPSEFPDARISRPLGVAELDRAHGPVDRHAGIAKLQGKPFDNDIGIGDVARFGHAVGRLLVERLF